jgi:hypothetical protein
MLMGTILGVVVAAALGVAVLLTAVLVAGTAAAHQRRLLQSYRPEHERVVSAAEAVVEAVTEAVVEAVTEAVVPLRTADGSTAHPKSARSPGQRALRRRSFIRR